MRIWEQLQRCVDWDIDEDTSRSSAAGGGAVYTHDELTVRTFDEIHLELERPAEAFDDPDLIVFVSRHAGETGRLLSTHFPGNVADAEYGGVPRELPVPAPLALSAAYTGLEHTAPEAYDVGIECTHHGPSDVGAPALFVELGSDEAAWKDDAAARAVAEAVLEIDTAIGLDERVLVGVGGGHYAPKFERVLRETDWHLGHILADWALAELETQAEQVKMTRRAVELSGATAVLIDGERPGLRDSIEDQVVRVVTETWVQETTGIPITVVDEVEQAFGDVDTGVRFGAMAEREPNTFGERRIPDALLHEAQGIDEVATRAAIERWTIAYQTTEAGNRLGPRALIEDDEAYAELCDALVEIVSEAYDVVEDRGDHVIVREEQFDPETAQALGVPEGPKFGQLAAGESIVHEGDRIDPADVTRMEERRIPTREH